MLIFRFRLFDPVDLTNVFQMKYTGNGDIYIDNVYFYDADGPTATDSDGDGVDDSIDQCADTPAGTTVDADGCELTTPTSPTAGAPVPTQDAANVISIFSDTYTQYHWR